VQLAGRDVAAVPLPRERAGAAWLGKPFEALPIGAREKA
jgi:hypothetical protein